jgi:DNA-directed RNA polymerase subunit RPC12/RpoP
VAQSRFLGKWGAALCVFGQAACLVLDERVGADIGIKCRTCGRRVLMPRRKFEKSVKKLASRG